MESKHGPLRRMLSASVLETGESPEFCLPSVCMARNTMTYVHGFTPAQLAFGRNLHRELSSDGPAPSMGGTRAEAYSNYAYKHLQAIQIAGETFHTAEAKTRVAKALNSKKRPEGFQGDLGDKVLYWVALTPSPHAQEERRAEHEPETKRTNLIPLLENKY